MEFSFPHYLLSKQSVDDRALNRHVLDELRQRIPTRPVRVIEIGAGIGTMLRRLLRMNLLAHAEYVMVEQMSDNIESASEWIPKWGAEAGLSVRPTGSAGWRLFDNTRDVQVQLEHADLFDFARVNKTPADLLLAHAVLDLLPLPASMQQLLALTGNLAWLTMNFDGLTTLEPVVNAELDSRIERLYHASMDARPTGGDSRSGRHLFEHVRQLGARVLAAGSSDWVVHSVGGRYPEDEAYFLQCILHFLEESLAGQAELDVAAFSAWLEERRRQIASGVLVLIAHQMDLLVKAPTPD